MQEVDRRNGEGVGLKAPEPRGNPLGLEGAKQPLGVICPTEAAVSSAALARRRPDRAPRNQNHGAIAAIAIRDPLAEARQNGCCTGLHRGSPNRTDPVRR